MSGLGKVAQQGQYYDLTLVTSHLALSHTAGCVDVLVTWMPSHILLAVWMYWLLLLGMLCVGAFDIPSIRVCLY